VTDVGAPSGRPPKAYRWRVVDDVEASDLPGAARHLMLTLCLRLGGHRAHTGQLGEYSPSLSELARITGWKLTAVKKYLGELERLGWLIRDQPPVKLQRSEKARTKYTVRIPGEPPDVSGLSRSPDDLEDGMSALSRSPDDHGLGRHATGARSPRDHKTEGQKKHNGARAADGRKPSTRRAATPTPPRPPWCGICHEQTRMRENKDGLPYRCPGCHPLERS
jgi:hypothetical protein